MAYRAGTVLIRTRPSNFWLVVVIGRGTTLLRNAAGKKEDENPGNRLSAFYFVLAILFPWEVRGIRCLRRCSNNDQMFVYYL